WIYLDQLCPSCKARLVRTTRFFATCPECWDCRLYPNPQGKNNAEPTLGSDEFLVRGEQVKRDFARLADPYQQAEVAVAVLSMLDEGAAVPEVVRLLTEARATDARRRAAEVLERLRMDAVDAEDAAAQEDKEVAR
ncbi:MAG: hypothetical protein ABIK89_22600, partial [Planctomycetota bacterium]